MNEIVEIQKAIEIFKKYVKSCESHLNAMDGLPGLYYDANEAKEYQERIEFYNKVIGWLEEFEDIKITESKMVPVKDVIEKLMREKF